MVFAKKQKQILLLPLGTQRMSMDDIRLSPCGADNEDSYYPGLHPTRVLKLYGIPREVNLMALLSI